MVNKLDVELSKIENRLTEELLFGECGLQNDFTIQRLKIEIKTLKREIKLLHIL